MNPTDRALALTVPCPLCKVPADTECVNSVDGSGPRDQPHHSRPVRARIVTNAITYNLTHTDATP
jgi:hypothetical protein